jgi:hypothetical protein
MNFVLNRNKTVESTKGHTVAFKKNEPTYVPPDMYAEVQALGAVPDEELTVEEPSPNATPTDQKVRDAAILEACKDVMLRNDRADFTANGAPSSNTLSAMVGFKVLNRERDVVWEALKQGTPE